MAVHPLKGRKILVTAYDLEQNEHRGIAVYSKSLIHCLNEAGADYGPGEQQAEGDVPLDLPDVPHLGQGKHLGHLRPVFVQLNDRLHQRLVDPEHHLPEVLGAGKLALGAVDRVQDVAAVGVPALPASVQVSGNVLAVTPGER